MHSDCDSPMAGCEIPDIHLPLRAERWDEAQEGDLGEIMELARVPHVRAKPWGGIPPPKHKTRRLLSRDAAAVPAPGASLEGSRHMQRFPIISALQGEQEEFGLNSHIG